jgi:hypothetical protein
MWQNIKGKNFEQALVERIQLAGDTPENRILAADIISICSAFMDKWTRRFDDAQRIPDVLAEHAQLLRKT